ncbi:hypothetical protein NP493_320g02065 [Ridgeia piscesae]|uniref:SH2 domain-containing protein n=1 Tax=Ridgeia piscesae TaxID=27915 RepID=A0AAD9L5E2_RIDPI|nr:hypothetical protein NP493_320g02065 [Ridgeia piscesae]
MAEAPVDDRYTLDDNIGVVLHDSKLLGLLSLDDLLKGGWRGLASRLNYSYDDQCKFERVSDPCRAVLEDWQTKPGSTIRAFLHALQDRHDIKVRLQYLMRGELELIGVLKHGESVTVKAFGRMTLKQAFQPKLREKGLNVSNLELDHPGGISWDSPAYMQKGLQVTYKEKVCPATQQRAQQRPAVPDDDEDVPDYENVSHGASGASEAISGAFSAPSEWELLPGWHPLGDKGANKNVIRDVLRGHLHEDGRYILTPYKRSGDVILSVTCNKATHSFRVHRRHNTTGQPQTYYIYSDVTFSSVQELIAHFSRHRLTDEVPVTLKEPVKYRRH